MPFLESLAAQLNEPTMLEGLRNRGAVAGIGDSGTMISSLVPDQKARYAANVARRLGTPAVVPMEPAAEGKGVDAETRYASNVARRLGTPAVVAGDAAPPMVTGPSMDAVQSAISDATRGY